MIDRRKITQWLKWAESVTLQGYEDSGLAAFPQFAMVWMAFNAVYNGIKDNRKRHGDGAKLKNFIKTRKELINRIHTELMVKNGDYIHAVKELKKLLDADGLRNLTGRSTSTIIKRQFPISVDNPDDFKEIVDVIYHIRNNLFHGDKTSASGRDERLCLFSYEILKDFLLAYLSNTEEDVL